jgi:hypothetical protein
MFARPRRSTAGQRALLAVDLTRGLVEVSHLTPRQARQLVKVSSGYLFTAARLSTAERQQVEEGTVSFSSLHNRPPTDLAIDRFIARAGADRVMAALDRYTQPSLKLMAAE